MSDKLYRQRHLHERCVEIYNGFPNIEQSRYPRFLNKLKEYVDVVLRYKAPLSEGECWDWKDCMEIEKLCYDIVSLLESPKEIGYFGKEIELRDVFLKGDGQTYLVHLKDALKKIDDNPHELKAYHSHDRMEELLRVQWKYIFNIFDCLNHINTPYDRFWDKLRELLYVFPDQYEGYKSTQFEIEKEACEGIVALFLNPGTDKNGKEIDLDVVFRVYNNKKEIIKLDWQKHLRNLEEVLEKVKKGKPFYFDIYTSRVVHKDPKLTDIESARAMKRAFEIKLAAKDSAISENEHQVKKLTKEASLFHLQYQEEKKKYEECLLKLQTVENEVERLKKNVGWSLFPSKKSNKIETLLTRLNELYT